MYLMLSLRDLTQSVLGDLPSDREQHNQTLVRFLQEKFSLSYQTDIYSVATQREEIIGNSL